MDIKTLNEILKKNWSKETCYEKIRNSWSPNNPAIGQCSVTSLIVNDFFGGLIIKGRTNDGIAHYWNLINGEEIDLTKSQFKKNEIITKEKILTRKEMEESNGYSILKSKILKAT